MHRTSAKWVCTDAVPSPTHAEAPQPELLDVDQLLDFDPAEASLQAATSPVQQTDGGKGKAKAKGTGKRSKPQPAAAADAADASPASKRAKEATGAKLRPQLIILHGASPAVLKELRRSAAHLRTVSQ